MENIMDTENLTNNDTVEESNTENLPVEAGCGTLKNQDLTITGNVAIVNTTTAKAGLIGFGAGLLAVPAVKKVINTVKGLRERRRARKEIEAKAALEQAETVVKNTAKKKSSNTDTTAE